MIKDPAEQLANALLPFVDFDEDERRAFFDCRRREDEEYKEILEKHEATLKRRKVEDDVFEEYEKFLVLEGQNDGMFDKFHEHILKKRKEEDKEMETLEAVNKRAKLCEEMIQRVCWE